MNFQEHSSHHANSYYSPPVNTDQDYTISQSTSYCPPNGEAYNHAYQTQQNNFNGYSRACSQQEPVNQLTQPYQTNYPSQYPTNNHQNYEKQHTYNSYNQSDPNKLYQSDSYTRASSEPKKSNPNDTIPHPIPMLNNDYRQFSGSTFDTSTYTVPPPFVSTLAVDYTGYKNCTPNFIRSSLYGIPNTSDLAKKCGIPLCLAITPFATQDKFEMPLIECGPDGPIRCRRCRAYTNPFIQFIDGGKYYTCNICTCVNDIPEHYFCTLDQTGNRLDHMDRMELLYGSYDLTTNDKYCRNNVPTVPPVYIFMIDVTYPCVSSGMVKQVVSTLIDIVSFGLFDSPSSRSGVRIGLMTYDSTIHIYCPTDDGPQMEVITDIDEPFITSLNSFVVDPFKHKDSIIQTLHAISEMFNESKTVDTMLAPVINTAIDAISSLHACGKLFIFHGNMPSMNTEGKLVQQNERSQLGGEDEKKVLAPQTNYYTTLATKCIDLGVGVDLYLFPNGPVEVASLVPLCSTTGGNLRMYKYYKTSLHGCALSQEIKQNVAANVGLDCMAKLRCSNGISVKNFYGNLAKVNDSEFLMSTIDTDQSMCAQLVHDDNISGFLYLQFSILYTSPQGRRLIRVHNLCLNVVENIFDVFKSVDQDVITHFYMKRAVSNLMKSSISNVKNEVISDLVRILASYRKDCASQVSSLQLIMPERLKLLPLYVNAIFNLDAISGSRELTPDDKSYAIYVASSCNLRDSNVILYPRVLDVISIIEPGRILNDTFEGYSPEYFLPNGIVQLRCAYDRLSPSGIYLLDQGYFMFLWIGKQADQRHLSSLFGTTNIDQYSGTVLDHFPAIDSELSRNLAALISQIRNLRNRFMRIFICQQEHKSEYFFKKLLTEDKGFYNGSTSCIEFLCILHQEIRKLLID